MHVEMHDARHKTGGTMMFKWWRPGCWLVAASFAASALAQEPVKVGMVIEASGPFADIGRQILDGARAYMMAHGDTVAGRKIELVVRDTTGAAPDIAKRHAQQLVT